MNTDFFLRLVHPTYLYIALLSVLCAVLWRYFFVKHVQYKYALSSLLRAKQVTSSRFKYHILYALRLCTLLLLAFLIAKPQWVDSRSKIKAEGIDIILVLDVSGSMELNDFDDQRTRIAVAKEEAIHFIEKRQNDAIGLVLFAQDVISRIPLTHDQSVLKSVIEDLSIGVINPNRTRLATGMMVAVNRLKECKGCSKVMIVLTDGEPSGEELSPEIAIEAAKQYGVKVYTVGIGSDKPVMYRDGFGRIMQIPGVNTQLLDSIAHETGGRSFLVSDAQGMRTMYDTIDQLETRELEIPIYAKYYDIFVPFVFILLFLVLFEVLLSSVVWFSI